jgi:hypothetical protein
MATRPTGVLPQKKGAAHQLRGIDQIVGLPRSRARLEATGPVRFLQLALQRLVGGNARQREEAILELTRQNRNVSQELQRLPLSAQQRLNSLDDCVATSQEKLQ